jgi:hypothetical protein
MSVESVLEVIKANPDGLWLREIARMSGVSASTVCNYLYGYIDSRGRRVPPKLNGFVVIEKLGGGSLTLVKPKL